MYEALGFTGGKTILVAGIYNCVGPIASMNKMIYPLWYSSDNFQDLIFILFILDRVGRRRPLLFGTVGITLALICEAIINSQNPGGKRHGLSIGGVFFLFLVSIIFSLSFGPISWVYMSEIMPMQIRARGNAFATGIGNWLVATFFAQISPIALGEIGWKFYFVFVGMYLAMDVGSYATADSFIAFNIVVTFPVIFFFFKETKQVSLEDIDLLFGERALGTLPDDLHDEKFRSEGVQVETRTNEEALV